MNVTYRLIQPEDNRELAAVIRGALEDFGVNKPGTVYTDPTTDALYELFQTPGSGYWVALDENRIIGGCGIFPTTGLPTGYGELVKLYLHRDYRGKGIGKQLLLKSFDLARELGYTQLYLESLPELNEAVHLYERVGFQQIPCRMGESGHFACDLWMTIHL
jgi:putative acetyltransferase